MRGQGESHPDKVDIVRITPADAGTSHGDVSGCRHGRDHPRGCGDKTTAVPPPPTETGSPPRMRGQDGSRHLCCWLVGITPADAGTSPQPGDFFHFWEDHPRGCGDKEGFH